MPPSALRSSIPPENRKAEDFQKPGHIFPLAAKEGGVLRRTGHTEAAIDFARLSGFKSAGVIVEIMNDDGTMARVPDLIPYAKKHSLNIICVPGPCAALTALISSGYPASKFIIEGFLPKKKKDCMQM